MNDDPSMLDQIDPSEIESVTGIHPRCDICNKAQQPEDDWNGETGNHRDCERAKVTGTKRKGAHI